MTKNNLLLIGGGGHCKSVIDSLNLNQYGKVGIIDREEKIGKVIAGIEVIGSDDILEDLFSEYKYAFITLGSIGNTSVRRKIYNNLNNIGYKMVNIIDSSAVVSEYTELEEGIFIGKNVIINSGSVIKNNVILNSGAIIEHDVVIEEFSHIAPGSIVLGKVKINKDVHVGAGSILKQGIEIGEKTVIGMGSNVLNSLKSNVIAYGNPCKERNE